MFQFLLKARYLVVVIVVVALLDAIGAMVLGVQGALHAYALILTGNKGGGTQRPGIEMLHSLDFLIVAMVLVVLALGIAKLFLRGPAEHDKSVLPAWLRIDSITELKVLIWEMILTTLLIVAMSELSEALYGQPTWTILLTPVAILMLAVSLFFMKRN
jgi:uncharacterized membrane protein YqhA